MRAYSQSQGRFIEVPETQTGGETQAKAGSGGQDYDQLVDAIRLKALTDPKNVSKYSALLKMFQPSASETNRKLKQDQLDSEKQYKLEQINDAIDLLENKKLKTGKLSGRILSLKSNLLGASANENSLYSVLNELAAKEMFELGGKTLPAQEINRIKPFVPQMLSTTELNLTNLKKMKKNLEEVYGIYDRNAGALTPEIDQVTDYDGFEPLL